MGSWKDRGNQYTQLVKVLYCKLPNNGKQLPAFPLEGLPGNRTPASEVGGESVTMKQPNKSDGNIQQVLNWLGHFETAK